MGQLMLGRESVIEVTKKFMSVTEEVHLHGVKGYEEHLSLAVLPKARISKWVRFFKEATYRGVISLVVFRAEDLETSIDLLFNLGALPPTGILE